MLIQTIECVFAGMKVGFIAFWKALPFYNALRNINKEFLAALFGVPVILVSVALIVISIAKKIIKVKQ